MKTEHRLNHTHTRGINQRFAKGKGSIALFLFRFRVQIFVCREKLFGMRIQAYAEKGVDLLDTSFQFGKE